MRTDPEVIYHSRTDSDKVRDTRPSKMQAQATATQRVLSRPPAAQYSIRVQTGGIEILESLAAEWERIAEEYPAGEVFYRPEWAHAFLKAFAPSAKLVVVSAW